MNLREKIKSYSFWVSLASAVILILKVLGSRFGFQVDETMISDLFTALCSILVLLGIIVVPQQKQATNLPQENQHVQEVVSDKTTTQPEPVEEVTEVETQPNEDVLIADTCETFDNQNPFVQVENETEESVLCSEQGIDENQHPELIQTDNQTQCDSISVLPETISCDESLKDYLSAERNKFANNIDEFVKLLQDEIDSIKPKKEA